MCLVNIEQVAGGCVEKSVGDCDARVYFQRVLLIFDRRNDLFVHI